MAGLSNRNNIQQNFYGQVFTDETKNLRVRQPAAHDPLVTGTKKQIKCDGNRP